MSKRFKTRDKGDAIIFATTQDAPRPYVGAYWTGEEWIPTSWKIDGRWHDKPGYKRGLDLVLHETTVSQGQGPETTTNG